MAAIAELIGAQRAFEFSKHWRAESLPRKKGGEIVVDLFCGGGGASVGIEDAIGSAVDEAVNHSPDAIFYHEKNHPATNHHETGVFDVHPLEVTKGHPVGLLWLSPDCTHFAKARGAKPKDKGIRSLATVGLWWASQVRPRVMVLENVEEFKTWCRLDKRTNQPDKRKSGEHFHKFVRRLRQHGYDVDYKVLRACDFGAPTIRKRFFLIARNDGLPIEWPKPTHGPKCKRAYRTAAECIDFTIPTTSIFATKAEVKAAGIRAVRPLADNTMERIARGIWKFVINNPNPFVVPGSASPFITEMANASNQRNMPADEPMRTICAQVKGGHFALVNAFLSEHRGASTGHALTDPMPTTTSKEHHSMVACSVERMHSTSRGEDVNAPLSSITAQTNHHALVTSHLMSYHKQQGEESRCYPHTEPLPTVDGSNRFAEVRAFLIKYYGQSYAQGLNEPLGTITGNDRFGLVTVEGQDYRIVDIGLRMLTPAELLRAQFGKYAAHYRIDGLTKTKAVKMIGNSVCPDLSCAIVKSNFKRRSARQLQVAI